MKLTSLTTCLRLNKRISLILKNKTQPLNALGFFLNLISTLNKNCYNDLFTSFSDVFFVLLMLTLRRLFLDRLKLKQGLRELAPNDLRSPSS